MLTPAILLLANNNFTIKEVKNIGSADFILSLDSDGDGRDEIEKITGQRLVFKQKTHVAETCFKDFTKVFDVFTLANFFF